MIHKLKILIGFLIVSSIFLFHTKVFAGSAYLFFTEPPTNIKVGDTFNISLKIKSTATPINAVSGIIKFSDNILKIDSVSRDNSIINIWTSNQTAYKDKIEFEGVILDPGYIGSDANILNITFTAKNSGSTKIELLEGSVLANDGFGTNILSTLRSLPINVLGELSSSADNMENDQSNTEGDIIPVITQYSQNVASGENILIIGKGQPNAFTKLSFRETSVKSVGERLIAYMQSKKEKPNDVIVKNTSNGDFAYTSSSNLIAGVYSIIPSLVDHNKNIEKSGPNVNLFINDNLIVHYIIVLINILLLIVPVVALLVIIYFIPWYSVIRMRTLRKKIALEEEKIELSEQELKKNIPKCDDSQNSPKTL